MENNENIQKPVIVKGRRYAFSGDIENGRNPDGTVRITHEEVTRRVSWVDGDRIRCECGRVFLNNGNLIAREKLSHEEKENIVESIRDRRNALRHEIEKEILDEMKRRGTDRADINGVSQIFDGFDTCEIISALRVDGDAITLINEKGEEFDISETVSLDSFYILEDLLS